MSQPAVAAAASASLLAELRAVLGPHRVSTRPDDRAVYARDMWTRGLLAIAAGQPPGQTPGVIVWPETTAEVQAIVRIARSHGVPLVPFGAGSGVTGAAVPTAGGLVLDMKRMRALHIDAERSLITCEPGLLGSHLEDRLNRRGLTLGHFPSSIMCSTVGGWLATRGAGQMSTKYGKVEDLVQSLEVVTGTGEHLHLDSGDHGGPDLLQLFIGSEGTLGIITRATFLVRPLPAARRLRGYWFADVASGCGAIRHLLQLGLRPAVVRLYDELDTLISGAGRHRAPAAPRPREGEGAASFLLQQLGSRVGKLDLGSPNHPPLELEDLLKLLKPDAQRARSRLERWLVQAVLSQAQPINRLIEALMPRLAVGCLLILGFEGEPELATAEDELARSELLRLGARDLGEEPGQHWLRHRYDVSFKLPKAFAAGAFADTLEVATTWDRLGALYREVRAALGQQALVMAHFSHAYPDGCSIYFSFIGRALSTSGPPEHRAEHRTEHRTEHRGEHRAAPGAEHAAVMQARLAADQRCYDALWQGAVQAALRVGATISHHHGIGKLRTPFMATEHGPSLGVLRALKRVYDPDWLCNPGKLLAAPVAPSAAETGKAPTADPAGLREPLRALLGPERVEPGALRCAVRSTAEVQAVVRLARAHGVPVSCARRASSQQASGVQLDLSGMAQVAPVRTEALLVEAQAGITLWQLEQGLRAQGLTLGPLPPWTWTRTLGAALAAPQPAEASLGAGRLRDRRVRVTTVLLTGRELTAPPTPAPRRAAGPELAQALLGSGAALGVITAAMLRVARRPATEHWLGWLLDDELEALRALELARSLHGGTVLSEVVLCHRELLERAVDPATLPPGRLALLVASTAPGALASAALRLLSARIFSQRDALPEALCRELYGSERLFSAGASLADAARLGSGWPQHQRPLHGPLGEQAALLRAQAGPYLVAGVHLHGATLVCTTAEAGVGAVEPAALADAQTLLWPPLRAALVGDLDPPG